MGFDLLVMLNIVITVAVAQITNAGHSVHNEIIDQYIPRSNLFGYILFQPCLITYLILRIVHWTNKKRYKISIAFDLYPSNHN